MSTASNVGYNILGVISGVIGVLTAIPLIWRIARSQHPETKMKELESILKDTEGLLHSVVEEGLLDPQRDVPHFEYQLTLYRSRAESFREQTCIVAINWRKVFQAWLQGLSRRIATLCEQVKEIRAEICETSAEARMQLIQDANGGDEPTSKSTLRAFIRKLARGIVLIVRGPFDFLFLQSTDATARAAMDSPTADIVTSSTEGTGAVPTTRETACSNVSRYSSPSSFRSPSTSPSSLSGGSSSRSSGTVLNGNEHNMRSLIRALRRLDRELAAQGIDHPLLTDILRATKKQWSPASSKAFYRRRSYRRIRSMLRTEHMATLPSTNPPGTESEAEWLEDTMCEA
ncbi:hypothetical protein BD311DRAFT_730853 [Dichomitus squalens]|uniref:Uncharacterized protein n=1 Tax=Dichomitus squalens TaxID=114155 RepID=A0A4Q9MBN7_9APHY|nr:hypothetical protein BD311DRAFT_730853 [Dichomitus squalens]